MTPNSAAEAARSAKPDIDEQVLAANTRQRFYLLLVLFIAESIMAATDIKLRLVGSSSTGQRWLPYAAPAMLIVMAAAVYFWMPAWRQRRSRVAELADLHDDGLEKTLDDLVSLAGINARPRFVVDRWAPSTGAVVFGNDSKPTIRLNGGLIVEHTLAPKRFRAVVLHELAHVHNRDVGITYWTVAMWRVLLVAAVIPNAILLVAMPTPGDGGAVTVIQQVTVVLLVYRTRAEILQARETYADRMAVHGWGADPEALLSVGHEVAGQWLQGKMASKILQGWRTHPSWLQRARSLTAPDELFVLRPTTLLATGFAADVAWSRLAAEFRAANSWLGMAHDVVIAGLIVSVGGVALWRAIVHAALTKRRSPAGWAVGFWLGSGLALGELTSLAAAEGRFPPPHPEYLAVLIAVVALLMAWAAQFAEMLIATYRGKSLHRPMALGLTAPWLVLAFGLQWWNNKTSKGWDFAVDATLANAHLPTNDAPLLLKTTAALTALPGSDQGFSGLWWSIPLLWVIPLQLWFTNLPASRDHLWRIVWRVLDSRAPFDRRITGLVLRLPPWVRSSLIVAGLVLLWLAASAFTVALMFSVVFSMSKYGQIPALIAAVWISSAVFTVRERMGQRDERHWANRMEPESDIRARGIPDLRWVVRIGAVGGTASILGLLAEPLVLRSVVETWGWQVRSEIVLVWVVLVVGISMIAVAVVAAIAANGRIPLITALIAAGVTAIVGITGQYLKGTMDGCLGPLNSLKTNCTWDPLRYLSLTESALGYVLAPGLVLAASAAAVTSEICRALFPRRRSATPSDEPSTSPTPFRPVFIVRFVNYTAIYAVASITALSTAALGAPMSRVALLYQYQASPTGHIRTGAYPKTDGMDYIDENMESIGDIVVDIFKRTYDRRKNADLWPGEPQAYLPCDQLSDIADTAETNLPLYYPPLAADPMWDSYLATIRIVADDCRFLDQASTSDEFNRAWDTMQADYDGTTCAKGTLTNNPFYKVESKFAGC
ncbi:M48 family metalloprotease [Nocardia sp. CA-119907]|uniref:M48 family metalloprotease n=1 Tax=Nocardia sp. CA-119907 TaxID=3239973 RepID=UPI003D9570CF